MSTGCHNGAMTHSRFDGLCIIDADTHLTEPHDLWTARAPKGYEDRVPQVHDVDGVPTWTMDGKALSRAGASGVVGADGVKVPGTTFFQWNIEDVHPAAYDVDAARGAHGRAGHLGADRVPQHRRVRRPEVPATSATRRSASCRSSSTTTPWPRSRTGRVNGSSPWGSCRGGTSTWRSREIERMATLGLRGVNTTTAPHDHGLPDLGDRALGPDVGSRAAGSASRSTSTSAPASRRCRGSARCRGRRSTGTRSSGWARR